jgi:hypothetical protein
MLNATLDIEVSAIPVYNILLRSNLTIIAVLGTQCK